MHPGSARRPVAAVIGHGSPPAFLLDAARSIGRGLAEAGFRVATGGLGGVMEAASRGAREAPGACDGCVLGVLPGLDAAAANPHVDIAIPTGLSHARNVVLTALADVVVAVGGGAGTLSEIALAWQHGKPVVALDLGQGWSARLAGVALDERRDDVVHRAASAEAAVATASRLVKGARGES
jgi:hypothetical protein